MKNGNGGRDVLSDSRKRYHACGQRWDNTDRAKNKSDCRICYRALLQKKQTKQKESFTFIAVNNY